LHVPDPFAGTVHSLLRVLTVTASVTGTRFCDDEVVLVTIVLVPLLGGRVPEMVVGVLLVTIVALEKTASVTFVDDVALATANVLLA
jgi:hypothetical protein